MNSLEQIPSLEKKITLEDGRNLHQQILLCGKNYLCIQECCNKLFDEKRRERMVAGASIDRKGRKVRYYRKIGQDIFLRALNEGGHSIENNHLEDFDRELPEKKVEEFFFDYADDEELISFDEWKKLSLQEVLERITSNKEAIDTMIKRKTNRNVVDFIQTHCNPQRLEIMHAGSRFMEFSPYLSASVGGSFAKYLRQGDILLEMIIADEKISSFPSGSRAREGEKHVYLQHGIDLGEISRVFTSTDQYRKEVLENKTIPIGEGIIGKLGEKDSSLSDQIEQWRWNKPTDDCLPVGLLERYGLHDK